MTRSELQDSFGMEGPVQHITRESFYSGLNGTTKAELNTMVAVFPSSILLFSLLQVSSLFTTNRIWLRFPVEFLTVILPVVLALTILSNQLWLLLTAQLALSLLLLSINKEQGHGRSIVRWTEIPMTGGRQFLTNFRVFVNVATVVSILAVDFQVFPRRFAKTETYGTGLMDAGVGLFMIANALVSPEARGRASSRQRSLSAGVWDISQILASCSILSVLGFLRLLSVPKSLSSGLQDISQSLVSCSPLLVLGFLRLLSVKSVDYHEHVSEYGVHWNFFFTLAAVRILVTIVFTLVPLALSALMAAALAVTYQYLLNIHGLEDYILHGSDGQGSRDGILEANREGIYSCIGYTAIYLAGISLGSFLFRQRSSVSEWFRCLLQLLLVNGALFLLSALIPWIAEPVSRRLANLPYVLWIVIYCLTNLTVYLAVDICLHVITAGRGTLHSSRGASSPLVPYGPSRRTINGAGAATAQRPKPSMDRNSHSVSELHSIIVDAINKNQLFNFLLANLLTGAVNLSMDTVGADTLLGFLIIVAYTFILCLVMVVLFYRNIKTKFW